MARELSLRFLFVLWFIAACGMTGVFASSGAESSKSASFNAPGSVAGGPSSKYQVLRQKFDAYQGRGGQLSITEWAKRTRGQEWGIGKVDYGFAKWSRGHGNSLSATGPHDIYVIRGADTGRILHSGETGRGFAPRLAEHQRYYAELGINIEGTLLRTAEGKAAAKALELRYMLAICLKLCTSVKLTMYRLADFRSLAS